MFAYVSLLTLVAPLSFAISGNAHSQTKDQRTTNEVISASGKPTLSYEGFAREILKNRWPDTLIRVCWENPEPNFAAQMQLVKQYVEETWQKYSALTFSGWEECIKRNPGDRPQLGVHIRIADASPEARGIGKELDGLDGGVFISFVLKPTQVPCADMPVDCLRAIVVHEFGHIVGLTHEEFQRDAPDACTMRRDTSPAGDHGLTLYDKDSVMNSCNPHAGNLGVLSACDIYAIQQMYGKPTVEQAVPKCDAIITMTKG
jgi:hypothetical protein